MLKQQEREKELDCKRFCSYSISDILGISIENQYLYIVQNTKISVYQYHGKNDIPQLSEELIHNSVIENYCINKHYICICSSSLIEVRDRKHWENVIYSDNFNQTHENISSIILQEHFLFISKIENGYLAFLKIDVESKQVIANINLGKVNQSSIQILKTIKPIFLSNLGTLKDFYIWTKSNNKVSLGMLLASQGISQTTFQINQIEIKDGIIKQVYHHLVNCVKYPYQSTEYVVIIVQNEDKELYLHLYVVASKEKDNETLQGIISQFQRLKNINEPRPQNSLVQEVFSEAIANQGADKSYFQIKLEGLFTYSQSYICEGKIWVVSQQKICEIELISQQIIENIVKNRRTQQNILKSIVYHNKPKGKQFIGLYKQRQLFTQTTTSFDIVLNRQANDEIAQEIEEYEVNDQILEKQTQIRIAEAEKQIQDFIKLNLDEKDQEQPQKQKMNECIQADYCLQTEPIIRQTKQFATQTPPIQQKIIQKAVPIGLQSIQDLVAKYSSSVSVSCMKLKQNNYIKDKFDRQIFNIMDGLVKESVQPYLQSKFIAHLDQKIKDITLHISTVFQTQLQGLNQFVRKNQAKESNLRGRRIFQFSNQIKDIKQTVSIITDTLKANQIQKYAFNELILEQAKEMKQEITKISTSISQLDQKNQVYEKEISSQITEIFQLIKTLQEKHKQNLEDDSSCQRESEAQSEQREIDETSEQQNLSADSRQEFQREQMHYRYPPYNNYAVRGIQEGKRNKKSLQSLDKKGYTPYPSPQFYHAPTQMPYYYPFMPQIPSLPMHGYYPPNYSYTHSNKPEGKSQVKKGKTYKKTKKGDE